MAGKANGFMKETISRRGKVYLTRWAFKTPWFGIFLHRFTGPDEGDPHDHPFDFVTITLAGAYSEHLFRVVDDRPELYDKKLHAPIGRYRIARRKAETIHRVVPLGNCPVWTLVFRGPYRRPWGFYTPQGYVPYDRYTRMEHRRTRL